ncbi:imelysin family protein [Mucilaginibacter sp. RB4R14]|uniref:imelysin family protein n=1 Tax=Mucilaginibacter aurantiaciroseus TaxID=2949308 RepID=UPI002090A9CF|nr:imelysin family protein [Mucilaginibacter aurantiaciroseus]MCO5934597.1 imelysin family protein [Mucilaginibacter aurantiaciroseus]
MMIINRLRAGIFLGIAAFAIGFVACSKSDNSTTKPNPAENGFDKAAMLTNYADNLIIPAYTSLQTQLGVLEIAANSFLAAPTFANKQALKIVFKDTYLKFEHVSVDQFGPAEAALFTNFTNTFPTDSIAIEGNITRGTYSFNANSAVGQQGFPALDYLLFSPNHLNDFSGANAVNRKKYVQDVIARLKTLTGTVLTGWQNTYRASFITNTRSDSGSPIAFLINQFAFEMDQLKGPRIGWPFGKQSADILFPNNTEGFNAGISVALATENLISLKAMFNGNGSGKGMSDYLIALKKDKLSSDVLTQFDKAINGLKAVPDPYATSMSLHKTEIEAAYREIQILLTLIKTDVASATGVRITYQDTDGD